MTEENLILCVAPNGAYKTKKDHPNLPMTPMEIAQTAKECFEAGANMLHLHVREGDGSHSLDADRYRDAISAIRETVGENMVIQITTEAAKKFSIPEQMKCVYEVKPEAVSLGLREFVQNEQDALTFKTFWNDIVSEGIWGQIILYDLEDLNHLNRLKEVGVLGDKEDISVLFVLGRYSDGHSSPHDLIPFLNSRELIKNLDWSVCAFGPHEHHCLSAALAFGGHVRVGFENNLTDMKGEIAPSNTDLVRQISNAANALGRKKLLANNLRFRTSI